MIQLNSHEYDINNKFSIEEFRDILDSYEKVGATHLQLSYEDYGNPIINIFEETEQEQQDIPVLYHTIKNKIGWSEWCDVTNGNHYALNEGYAPKDNDIFYCTPTQAKELEL